MKYFLEATSSHIYSIFEGEKPIVNGYLDNWINYSWLWKSQNYADNKLEQMISEEGDIIIWMKGSPCLLR